MYASAYLQAGPVLSINLPESKDEVRPKFGFCHYESVVSAAVTICGVKQILWLLHLGALCLQESAKYAHSLFHNSVTLYGRSMRVDYSPQGNPEPRAIAAANVVVDAHAAAPVGSLAAAGGGFILKRKNRNADLSTSLPPVQSDAAALHS